MNVLFFVAFVVCGTRLLLFSPQDFLPALLSSATSAAALCVSLISTYCVFCGLSAVWEDSGLTAALARRLRRPIRALFKIRDDETETCICTNVAANLLGLGSVATPYGVKAASLIDEREGKHRDYALAVLFTLNAASLQAIPTSVIALRTAVGSATPADVTIPVFLSSFLFLAIALSATIAFYRPRKARKKADKKRQACKENKNAEAIAA